jgi:hypothetical protein
MKLFELFKSEVELRVVDDTGDTYAVRTQIDNKTVRFVAHDNADDGIFDVEFAEVGSDGSAAYNKTKTGKEFKTFAFVQACMKNFLTISKAMKTGKVKKMVMAADGQNRFELYKRMLTKSMPAGWKIEYHGHEDYDGGEGGNIWLTKE